MLAKFSSDPRSVAKVERRAPFAAKAARRHIVVVRSAKDRRRSGSPSGRSLSPSRRNANAHMYSPLVSPGWDTSMVEAAPVEMESFAFSATEVTQAFNNVLNFDMTRLNSSAHPHPHPHPHKRPHAGSSDTAHDTHGLAAAVVLAPVAALLGAQPSLSSVVALLHLHSMQHSQLLDSFHAPALLPAVAADNTVLTQQPEAAMSEVEELKRQLAVAQAEEQLARLSMEAHEEVHGLLQHQLELVEERQVYATRSLATLSELYQHVCQWADDDLRAYAAVARVKVPSNVSIAVATRFGDSLQHVQSTLVQPMATTHTTVHAAGPVLPLSVTQCETVPAEVTNQQ